MEAHAVHGVLSEARQTDLEQRELLHPPPVLVAEKLSDIHSLKTPAVPLEV